MSEIWARRKVTSDDLKTQMHAEWQKWLQLLLKLIDVTADQADVHLKLFIKGRGVAKLFKKDIERMVSFTLLLDTCTWASVYRFMSCLSLVHVLYMFVRCAPSPFVLDSVYTYMYIDIFWYM